MKIGTSGILVDHLGQVLLVQRNDTRTFAPPGGALERGELPPQGIIREMKEETGLIVLPVRLASLDYWDDGEDGLLLFNFRCLLRGGDVTPSPETPHVGFYTTQNFPRPMLPLHRRRLEVAMRHAGGPPLWGRHSQSAVLRLLRYLMRQTIYRFLDLKRKVRGQRPYTPPPEWQLTAHLIVQNQQKELLWVRSPGEEMWRLPGGESLPGLAPWETAVGQAQRQINGEVELTNLAAVTVPPGSSRIQLYFTAAGPQQTAAEKCAYFRTPPANSDAAQRALLPAALLQEETEFFETPGFNAGF